MSKLTQTTDQKDSTESHVSPVETIQAITENYTDQEAAIVRQLKLKIPNHNLTTGTTRELVWGELFRSMIPKKFCIDQGVFIIDSFGNISAEVDLAIFDEQYTPYIFCFGNIKFIPIEAVAVAIQCKSKSTSNASDWAGTIKPLKTSLDSVYRIIGGLCDNGLEQSTPPKGQTSTRPILILCTSVEGANITKATYEKFDIVLNVGEKNALQKTIKNEDKDYSEWYKDLNHYGLDRYGEVDEEKYKKLVNENAIKPMGKKLSSLKVSDTDEKVENVLLSLTFQLNQLLMLINNPIPFPHQAYATMFNENYAKYKKIVQEKEQKKEQKK
ncbi:DUF6602 domain-containing protein [Paenibacillus sp. RC334]|uniref:DUF6602 domain-containing protein n=1 Tax=Paenibacillus sp. RC334 TaxID=3045840 RepID=UPI0024BA8E24|nr:DUF6602 domain-containing protein [Paenibacillus sp. RC334]